MEPIEGANGRAEVMVSLRGLRVSYADHETLHGFDLDVMRG